MYNAWYACSPRVYGDTAKTEEKTGGDYRNPAWNVGRGLLQVSRVINIYSIPPTTEIYVLICIYTFPTNIYHLPYRFMYLRISI